MNGGFSTKKYTDLQELDATVLLEFIEKIYVYEKDKQARTEEIQIVYIFIGAFDFVQVRHNPASSLLNERVGHSLFELHLANLSIF